MDAAGLMKITKQLLQAIPATPHITKDPKINTPFHWEGPSKKQWAPAWMGVVS